VTVSWKWKASCACLVVLAVLPFLRADELEPARTHAVIVGVLEWKHGLHGYPKKHRKDQELRDLLVRRGTPAANIALLLDEDATVAKIREAVTRTARAAGDGSTLIVYYAGHGMPAGGGDYCFANYDFNPGKKGTGWGLKELGDTLAREFKGRRVLLWADCCFSGGLEVVVDRLGKAGIAAAALTSAGPANTSTNNWTFTQSLLDGLGGSPLLDANGDGRITLGELADEVREAMRHREGQSYGFKAKGVAADFVLARTSRPKPRAGDAKFPIGSYVQALDQGRSRVGRVVAVTAGRYTVEFYDYSDKRTAPYAPDNLTPSTGTVARPPGVLDAGVMPDCDVEWHGVWYPAKLLKTEKDKYSIHYVGYDASWDEWVGKDRIRMLAKKAKP
jgi:hypothetical protein